MARTYDEPRAVDPDREHGQAVANRLGQPVGLEDLKRRFEDREGSRELDAIVRAAPNLRPASKAMQTAFPEDKTVELADGRLDRPLPPPGEVRTLLSSRQRKVRSKSKNTVFDQMSKTTYEELGRLFAGRRGQAWNEVNDALSEVAGDATQLDEATHRRVRRIDRAIQSYEQVSGRGHLVYTNVEMPPNINSSNIAGYARNQFEPGSLVELDRYTAGTHCLHELEPMCDTRTTMAFEISTRRGFYVGSSDSKWNTAHLLPRGVQLYSHGAHTVTYKRPDGTEGTRVVVQLSDEPPKDVKVITPIDRFLKGERLLERRRIRAKNKAAREAVARMTKEQQ